MCAKSCRVLGAAVLGAVLGAGCSRQNAAVPPHSHAATNQVEIPLDSQQLLGIQVAELDRSPLQQTFDTTGTVRPVPDRVADVVSPIWGRIEYSGKPLAIGDQVKKGQVLVSVILELSALERHLLNDRTIELDGALREADVRRQQATSELGEYLKLAQKDPAYKAQADWEAEIVEQADGELRLIRAQVDRQKTIVPRRDPNRRDVVAPIDGTITSINFVAGDIIPETTYQKLFTITNLSEMWIEAHAFEKDIPLLQHIGPTTVSTQSRTSRTLPARFQALGTRVDPQTHDLPVWFRVDNTDRVLEPGMPVRLRIDLAQSDKVLLVPAGAILNERGQNFVFEQMSPTAFEKRSVRIGRAEGGMVEILQGIVPHARIATSGIYYISRAQSGVAEPAGAHVHIH
jgi:cobalt-zinc-cadmium efflux system membrane fusion protein